MRIDHVSLLVADVPRSLRFYAALGLRELPRPAGAAPGAWLAAGDQQLHLIAEREPGEAARMRPALTDADVAAGFGSHVALAAPDLEPAITATGVAPVGGLNVRGDGVRRVFLRDPDGHVVEVMEAERLTG